MECLLTAAGQLHDQGAGQGIPGCAPSSVARFEAQLQTPEPAKADLPVDAEVTPARLDDVALYLDAPTSTRDSGAMEALTRQFEALDLSPPSAAQAQQHAQSTSVGVGVDTPAHLGNDLSGIAAYGQEALRAQAEILRATLMMETMNAAKQGVTTLFQQQG